MIRIALFEYLLETPMIGPETFTVLHREDGIGAVDEVVDGKGKQTVISTAASTMDLTVALRRIPE